MQITRAFYVWLVHLLLLAALIILILCMLLSIIWMAPAHKWNEQPADLIVAIKKRAIFSFLLAIVFALVHGRIRTTAVNPNAVFFGIMFLAAVAIYFISMSILERSFILNH